MDILISNGVKQQYVNILLNEISSNRKTPTIASGEVRKTYANAVPHVEEAQFSVS